MFISPINNTSYSINKLNNLKIIQQISKLKQIDTHVKNHEAAHKSVGGSFAGSPSYKYVIGPDGKKYAVAGEVPIIIKKGKTPEETIENMEIVKAAALAPSDPSSQDLKVVAKAEAIENKARMKIYERGNIFNITA